MMDPRDALVCAIEHELARVGLAEDPRLGTFALLIGRALAAMPEATRGLAVQCLVVQAWAACAGTLEARAAHALRELPAAGHA